MGDIADAILEGVFCQVCGEYLGEGDGFPSSCAGCAGDDMLTDRYYPEPMELEDRLHQALHDSDEEDSEELDFEADPSSANEFDTDDELEPDNDYDDDPEDDGLPF